jgi:hypothetical protein
MGGHLRRTTMSNTVYEYTVHILDGVTLTTPHAGVAVSQARLIAAGSGESCFVDVRNTDSGGGYRLEYLPGGDFLRHSLQR